MTFPTSSTNTAPAEPKLSKAEILQQEMARRTLARRRLLYFVKQTYPQYEAGWVHEDICRRLEKFSQDVVDRKSPRLMLLMPPRHGKPIWEEERVIMGDGTSKPLKDIVVGDKVMTHKGRARKVTQIFEQGVLPTLRVHTTAHDSVVAAYDHPFFTTRGWVQAKDLRESDVLAKPAKFELTTLVKRRMSEFALAGYLIGDGNTTPKKGKQPQHKPQHNIRFSNNDPALQEDFKSACIDCGFDVSIARENEVRVVRNKMYSRKTRNTSAYLREHTVDSGPSPNDWVVDAGLVGDSHTKRVPPWVFQGTEKQIARFIGAYFSCDGTVKNPPSSENPRSTERCINLYSVNQGLIQDVGELLTLLGIGFRFCSKKQPEKAYGKNAIHYIAISDKDNLAAFADKIDVRGEKQERFIKWGFTAVSFPGKFNAVPVKKVEEAGDRPCRCLEVEEDHTFCVRGYIVHNSELASIRFPAWHLGHNPRHEIINVGYNIELPMKFSRKVREIIKDPAYTTLFPGTVIDPDSQSVEAWLTTAGGGFTAAGIGGGITGKGAHCLLIDDPIKNAEEADSITTRDGIWDWYQSTAYTRLAPGGGVLVIQTCWSDDDLAGRLQHAMRGGEEGIDQFEIIKYPAIAEEHEFIDTATNKIYKIPDPALYPKEDLAKLTPLRAKGEGLHLERYPTEALHKIKANLDPRIWSALYQQNPVPDEGMFFKREYFKYLPDLPDLREARFYAAWDFAIGVKNSNDYTVGVVFAQDHNDNLIVVDIARFKGDSFQIVEEMLNQVDKWSEGGKRLRDFTLGVEDTGLWKAIEPIFLKRCSERRIYSPFERLRPLTDKSARARPLQGRMQQGKVWFPENAEWKSVVQSELLRYPAGAHDDIVDAMAWAAQLAVNQPPPQLPKAKEPPSWKDKLNTVSEGEAAGSHMSA